MIRSCHLSWKHNDMTRNNYNLVGGGGGGGGGCGVVGTLHLFIKERYTNWVAVGNSFEVNQRWWNQRADGATVSSLYVESKCRDFSQVQFSFIQLLSWLVTQNREWVYMKRYLFVWNNTSSSKSKRCNSLPYKLLNRRCRSDSTVSSLYVESKCRDFSQVQFSFIQLLSWYLFVWNNTSSSKSKRCNSFAIQTLK